MAIIPTMTKLTIITKAIHNEDSWVNDKNNGGDNKIERKNENRLQYKSLSKYFIVGNRTIGEWNLLIENVTDSDLGEYKCALTRRSTKLKIESKPTILGLMSKSHQ